MVTTTQVVDVFVNATDRVLSMISINRKTKDKSI